MAFVRLRGGETKNGLHTATVDEVIMYVETHFMGTWHPDDQGNRVCIRAPAEDPGQEKGL